MNTADYLLAAGRPRTDRSGTRAGRRYTLRRSPRPPPPWAGHLAALQLRPGSRVGILGANSLFWVAGYLAVMKLGHVAVPFSDKLACRPTCTGTRAVGCAAVFADRRTPAPRSSAAFGPTARFSPTRRCPRPATAYWPDDGAGRPGHGRGADVHVRHHRAAEGGARDPPEHPGEHRLDHHVPATAPTTGCWSSCPSSTASAPRCCTPTCGRAQPRAVQLVRLPGDRARPARARAVHRFSPACPSSFQLLLRASTLRPARPAGAAAGPAGGRQARRRCSIEELLAAQAARAAVRDVRPDGGDRPALLPAPREVADKLGSIGKGIPGVELQVRGRGRQARRARRHAARSTPEARTSPPATGRSRRRRPRSSRTGGLRTGDLAVVDDDGYIYVVDRRDDFIKSWGHRISGQEVEACRPRCRPRLRRQRSASRTTRPGRRSSCSRGRGRCRGHRGRRSAARCRMHLPSYMAPRAVRVVEQLPLNANGKVDRSRLLDTPPSPRRPRGATRRRWPMRLTPARRSAVPAWPPQPC